MKLSYYGYSIERHNNRKRYLFDLRPFIRAFSELKDSDFKNQFQHAGEQLFLLNNTGDIYLFIMTRTNEVIKKIKSSDITVSEIYDLLESDEHLGFASYVYFGSCFLGFASTIMAPKAKTFGNFFNDLLTAIGIDKYRFALYPLLNQSTRVEAMSMPFIGRSVIQVTKENSLYDDIKHIIGGTTEEFIDVDAFEVIIKPGRKKNIESAVKKFIKKLPDDGLDKMILRAREEIDGDLMDVYLAGKGHVSDIIPNKEEQTVNSLIKEKIKANSVLAEKVKEHKANEEFEKSEPKAFANLHDAASWADRLSDI